MHNLHAVFAFSEAIQKLYMSPLPIDGLKSMLPALAVLFRSYDVRVDLLPFNGDPPRSIATLRAGEAGQAFLENVPSPTLSPSAEYVRRGGFAPILRLSNHAIDGQIDASADMSRGLRRPKAKDQLSLSVRLAAEALAITFHREASFSNEEAEIAGHLQKHLARRFDGAQGSTLVPRSEEWDVPLTNDLRPEVLPVSVMSLLGEYYPTNGRLPGELPSGLVQWLQTSTARQTRAPGSLARMTITSRRGNLQCSLRFHPRVVLTLLEKKSRYEFSRLNQYNLTSRQIDIAYWLTQGKADAEIAALLEVAPRTVSKHVETLLAKLGCENRTAAAVQIIEWVS